jgi:hypothetical protein
MRATEQTQVCKQLIVGAMGTRGNQGRRGSVKSARFEALLDKLVAVQMDLEPVCGIGKHRTQVISPAVTIAEACDILRSAIADVRNIICQADGLLDEPELVADAALGR